MLAEQRRAQILRALDSAGTLSTDELARELHVSGETIRRDLLLLDRRQLLRRIHGGAMAGSSRRREEPPFAERAEEAHEAKRRIGEFAAGLVSDGQTLILDVGTTVLALARALPASFRGTVATCSLVVAAELAGRPGVEVLVSGGRVRAGDLAVSNAHTVGFFSELRADIAFLGSGGVSADGGLTDFHLDEIATRKVMIARSAASYVLADAGKLERDAPHRVCGLDQLDAVVTDAPPPAAVVAAFEQAGTHVLFPD